MTTEIRFKAGNWHRPQRDDKEFVTAGDAINYTRAHSLRTDNGLMVWCVWEKQNTGNYRERFLILDGQLWQPA